MIMRFSFFILAAVVHCFGLFACDVRVAAASNHPIHDHHPQHWKHAAAGVAMMGSNTRTPSISVSSANKARPSATNAAAAIAATANIDNVLLEKRKGSFLNSFLHRGGAAALVAKNQQRYYKKHVVWNTPTMPPFMYPILDFIFILAYPCVAFFLLTDKARVVHGIISVAHIPLAMVTDYSCQRRTGIYFPNIPILPLSFMHLFDASWGIFAALSPFFLAYSSKTLDLGFHVFGILAFCFLAFLDPPPSKN
jgi:hypothetical protein